MVVEGLRQVTERIAAAAIRAGRDPAEVTLVVASKGRSANEILEVYKTGHRDFGENRSAELAAKAPELPDDIRWHFIGSLQTRQAKIARPFTYLLHSLDRQRLANAWTVDGDAPPALIQVNVAGEAQKHGVAPGEVGDLIEHAIRVGVRCVGLMTMAPLAATPEESRRWFVALRTLRDKTLETYPQISDLSMGMTDDFEVAIEEGATTIRVGRAIFGEPGAPATID